MGPFTTGVDCVTAVLEAGVSEGRPQTLLRRPPSSSQVKAQSRSPNAPAVAKVRRRTADLGATVDFRLRPQSGGFRTFMGPTAKGSSGSIAAEGDWVSTLDVLFCG
jgi:hypothetical protein